MVTPTKTEIDKKRKDYEKNLKKIDDTGKLSEKWAISSLRSAIRKEWMKNPVKLAVLYEAMVPDMNPDTRTKWLYKCAICGGMFKASEVEVDHCIGEHSFTSIDDFKNYWDNILMVPKSGLQVLCIEDHETKTYSERYNVPWDEAILKKTIIKKMNQPAKKQIEELLSYGYTKKDLTNSDKREIIYRILVDEGRLN